MTFHLDLADKLTALGFIFTELVSWLSTIISFLTEPGNAILGIFVLFAIVAIVMRMLKRWLPGL